MVSGARASSTLESGDSAGTSHEERVDNGGYYENNPCILQPDDRGSIHLFTRI